MATPQQIETKLRAPQCLNNIPFSARSQCPGTGTKSGRSLRCNYELLGEVFIWHIVHLVGIQLS